MPAAPIICFGQQPCGFLPRRFLVAKVVTARRLQRELGGEIVFFCHDSDHDCRETQTVVRHRATAALARLNFSFANKIQRKWSPLFAKKIAEGWKENTLRQLPAYASKAACEAVKSATASTVADFCLETYHELGLLAGIRVVRSGDAAVRRAACAVEDYFVDVEYEGEKVRARRFPGQGLRLHEGGSVFIDLPDEPYGPEQISPSRDSRLRWMQSVIHCTHYIAGAGEQAYLRPEAAPEIVFVPRDPIDRADEAYTEALDPDTVRL